MSTKRWIPSVEGLRSEQTSTLGTQSTAVIHKSANTMFQKSATNKFDGDKRPDQTCTLSRVPQAQYMYNRISGFNSHKFVHVCHFCNRVGHIKSRCYTLMNLMSQRMPYAGTPRRTLRSKVDLQIKGWRKDAQNVAHVTDAFGKSNGW